VAIQSLKKVFYLSTDKLEKIKREPHLAWDLFQPTKLDVYAPRIGQSGVKLDGMPDLEDRWHVDFIPCYTHQHFCLLVRIDRIDIVSQERAYQSGGGFVLLLATPREDNQDTDEFTVFGICPFEERESLQWSRFFVYYKDVGLVFKESRDAQIVVEKDSLYSYVLAVIPWKLAEPLTPFITREIGLNFWLAQAIDAEIPVQVHMLLRSERLIAEQQLRDYVLYEFEEPQAPHSEYEITYLLESKHLSLGTPGRISVGLNSPHEGCLTIRLLIDATEVANTETEILKGINRKSLRFATDHLGTGEHQLQLEISGKNLAFSEKMNISTYDLSKFSEMKKAIAKLKEREASSANIAESIATLKCLLETSMRELEELKPYSSFAELQNRFDQISDGISKVESNNSLPIMQENSVQLTDANFDKIVHEQPLAIIDFWSADCGPCRAMTPMIEELAKEYAGKILVGKIRADENPKTASCFHVRGVPTLLILKDGREIDRILGLYPKEHITEKLKKHLD